jgi:predicted metal-dependent hydrolase
LNITSLTALFKKPESPARKSVEIDGRSIPVTIVRSLLARRAALRVDAARGEIRLTLPSRVAEARGLRLIEANRDWIASKVAGLPLPRPIEPRATIPFEGREIVIDWQAGRPRQPRFDADAASLVVGGPLDGLAGRVERWLRKRALEVLSAETHAVAQQAGRTVEGVRVGDARGRWGSCTASGRIAYSWRLILAPVWVRRSVVAHEVAHLVHLNHSPDFHALHRELLGSDPAPARAWLAANGATLYWVGRPR